MTETDSRSWLEQELSLIQTAMGHTLNARLAPTLEAVDDESQSLTLRYPLQDWQVNGLGTLHGGIINTMLDLTMSMVVYCYGRQGIPPTVSLTTNYLRPVAMAEGSVCITARLTSLGRRNATAYGEAVIPSSGKTACTAIGTYAVSSK